MSDELNPLHLTPLETAVLDRLHEIHKDRGFPPAVLIRVLGRKNTGGGRYVDLETDARMEVDDGYIDLDGNFIEMKGLPHGMMAVALVKGKRVTLLEFTVYGGDSWSGEELDWRIT